MKATPLAIFASILLPAFAANADVRASASYSIPAESRDDGGHRAGSTNYTHDGSAGLISGTSTTASATGVLKSGYIAQLDSDTPIAIVSVVSRKVHGASGTFEIDLPRTGSAGIECRSGGAGGNHQVVVTFASPVTVGAVSVMSSDGLASATGSVNGAVVTLDLAAVANAQTLGITLNNVSNGSTTANVFVPMGVLLGDTTGNGFVTASDIAQTKGRSGQPVDASNFRSDVNASGGTISASDIALVKSRAGTQLP